MARKTVLVCDSCEKEIPEGGGATVTVSFTDARRSGIRADYCDTCSGDIKGETQAKRGRKPATPAPAPEPAPARELAAV